MGLFGSSDPAVKQEKMIAKEAKNEEKSIKQAVKDLSKAGKEEQKAAQAEQHSHSAHEKTVQSAHKVAEKLDAVIQKHDSAVSEEHVAANDVKAKTDAHHQAAAALQQKKQSLNHMQHAHHTHATERQSKLNELHRPADGAAGTATGVGALDHTYGHGQNNTTSPTSTHGASAANPETAHVPGQGHVGTTHEHQGVPNAGVGGAALPAGAAPGVAPGTAPGQVGGGTKTMGGLAGQGNGAGATEGQRIKEAVRHM